MPARNTDDDSSSTHTPVPIWIQSGGFYWSTVPDPTHGPGDIPSLPSFPLIPDPPCFRFGDLFSIHCPPDHNSPTTTWSSHVPRHTCTDTNSPGCGYSCTSHCKDTLITTSTCTAETVTNYWVSCSGTSCETTKSATFTGCSVTDSTTTTGDYCPTGVTIDPDGDQGATPWVTPTESQVIATSIPEIAIISGEPYTATRGSIVANGHTFKLLALGGSNQVTATIDDVSIVLIPSFTGTVTVAVIPTARTTTSTKTTTATGVPIGGICDTSEVCEGHCDDKYTLFCGDGVCKCIRIIDIPPYGTQCQTVDDCNSFYFCGSEDTMVCETRDDSHGAPLCLCIKGKIE
ncbi:hypothetical protein BJX66DRAFT_131941 [Aspergillus keveii]|uniref:Uncharacterized protein n=1 Tax=Aspergillus keveii TaxID=714993 RepID=A0ABR4FJD0_9EURO